MSDDKDDKFAEFFQSDVDQFGAACSTVKDGHVIAFKRKFLESLLAQYSDKDEFVIFVKRPDFKN